MIYANELSGWPMYLNQGKFRQNGGCGYILKPKIMRNPDGKGIASYYCLITSTSYIICLYYCHIIILTLDIMHAAYIPNMTSPHDAVTPINLEITVSS